MTGLASLTSFSFSVLVGMFVVFVSTKLLIRISHNLNLVDNPGGRKKHSSATPVIGGIAMFLGFVFSCLTLDISLAPYRSLFAGGALLVLVGIADDMHELTPKMRLLAQFFAACLMAFWGGVILKQFGDFFALGTLYLGYFGVLLTVLAVLGLINAINMLDGIDGLAGSLSFVQFMLLGFLAWHAGRLGDAKILLILAMMMLAFLWFNFPRKRLSAKVFMGDAGSMWTGFVLTWFCISLSQGPETAANPVTFLWIMAVPLFDLVSVVVRRISKRQSPFRADRQHLHHILHAAGYTARQSTLFVTLIGFILGLLGLLFNYFHVRGYQSFILFFVLFLAYHYAVCRAWRLTKVLKRIHQAGDQHG